MSLFQNPRNPQNESYNKARNFLDHKAQDEIYFSSTRAGLESTQNKTFYDLDKPLADSVEYSYLSNWEDLNNDENR